jgi:hypothetical protein
MNETLIAFETFSQPASETVADPTGFPVLPMDRQSDADFFGRLLEPQDVQAGVLSAPGVSENRLPAAIGGTNTLGSAFINVADKVGSDYKQNIQKVYSELESDTLTTRDLLKIQLDLVVASLEVDVIGKGVQKGVQHVDTLVNMK